MTIILSSKAEEGDSLVCVKVSYSMLHSADKLATFYSHHMTFS